MPTHSETKLLPHTSHEMFTLVSDVARYPEFLPWCSGARILSENDETIIAELSIGYKMISEKFVSRVHLDPESKTIHVNYISGPLKYLRNEWRFRDMPENSCRVDFFVHFEFSNPILSKMMNMFFDVAFRRMVQSFENRAEEIYGLKS